MCGAVDGPTFPLPYVANYYYLTSNNMDGPPRDPLIAWRPRNTASVKSEYVEGAAR